ncbi:tyrosine-type recombinase/integrase [Candidatus Bathyarchaeota archaeon A05DMB-2]|nr:tyrosine-type recombinase/integrase [Candidatus Bathyarchaeota archaeon A05DMB-2]
MPNTLPRTHTVTAKKQHPHHMRHSHCVAFIRKNNTLEGLRKLQKRIGHASISTTAEYLQFGPEQQKETEDVFGEW